jgi:hypothetical protein
VVIKSKKRMGFPSAGIWNLEFGIWNLEFGFDLCHWALAFIKKGPGFNLQYDEAALY